MKRRKRNLTDSNKPRQFESTAGAYNLRKALGQGSLNFPTSLRGSPGPFRSPRMHYCHAEHGKK